MSKGCRQQVLQARNNLSAVTDCSCLACAFLIWSLWIFGSGQLVVFLIFCLHVLLRCHGRLRADVILLDFRFSCWFINQRRNKNTRYSARKRLVFWSFFFAQFSSTFVLLCVFQFLQRLQPSLSARPSTSTKNSFSVCNSTGKPLPSVVWTFGSQVITPTTFRNTKIEGSNSERLVISKIWANQTGTWRCAVSNAAGQGQCFYQHPSAK